MNRLEEIEEYAGYSEFDLAGKKAIPKSVVLKVEHYEWLVQQAKRAEKNAQDLEIMDRQLASEQERVRELERGSVEKFLDRLRTLSGTGNGIGASTIARLYILAEREGFLKGES